MGNNGRVDEHLLGAFIPIHYHYNMLLDQVRMSSFREAIDYLTPAGGRVLELGGGTGVLSYFAAQTAAQVWCVERHPELVEAARRLLKLNGVADRVDVVQMDAFEYLPPEPVDVVICEMLHVGLIREQQVAVLESFKRRYLREFGLPLPKFIPEASLLAVQPVEHGFDFHGYHAPVPVFQDPGTEHSTVGLAHPHVYASLEYDRRVPQQFGASSDFVIDQTGRCNAIRFITKNILAFQEDAGCAVEWSNQFLIAPLQQPLAVAAGDQLHVQVEYEAGCELSDFLTEVSARKISTPMRPAA